MAIFLPKSFIVRPLVNLAGSIRGGIAPPKIRCYFAAILARASFGDGMPIWMAGADSRAVRLNAT